MNKVRLNIAGMSYSINSTDSEEHVLDLAAQLDSDINQVMEQSPSASVAAAAVLCALDYLDKLENANKAADNMRTQIKQYLEEANRARSDAEKVRLELEKLKVDIEYLKNQKENNGQ